MHPYKMMLSKELCERDIETRRALCLEIQQHVPHATAVLFSIWGPYFFEEDVTVTVNSDRYCEMLKIFLRPKLNMLHNMENAWFQQDGATAHTFQRAMGILREMFPGHLISLRGDISWSIHSPDLNRAIFSSGDTSSQRCTLIALALLNNFKM